jgi:hypothetical protein
MRRRAGREERLPVDPFEGVLVHGSVVRRQDGRGDANLVVRGDPDDLLVERRVVELTERESVGQRWDAVGLGVADDVRRVEQRSMTEPADGAAIVVGVEHHLAEPALVKANRPDEVGHFDPNFMPVYIFKPSGHAVAVNIKMATEDPGVWRRDAEGRLTLKLDGENGSRRLSEDGELLNVADPPGAVFPGPGTALWRVPAETLRTRLAEIEEMERRLFGPRPPATPTTAQP